MPSNSSIVLGSFDFDSNMASLTTWLQGQSQFQDYDFSGSNMNVLLSLLSVNTFRDAFLASMTYSETFLPTCQLRSSAVSRSKDMNYVPRSARSSMATLDLNFQTNNQVALVVPQGLAFTGRTGSNTYTFTVAETQVVTSNSGAFSVEGLDVYEGAWVTDSFVYQPNTRFILSNPSVDTTSLDVTVSGDGGSTWQTYVLQPTLLGINGQTLCYFLGATETEDYEVYFGNGVLGYQLPYGALIQANYRTSSGPDADGISSFTLNTDITNGTLVGNVAISVTTTSVGGSDPEDISSIKFNAPRALQTQNSAITDRDYENLLKQNFPEIQSVHAYGGENLSPPQYGKTFISVSLNGISGLPTSKQQQYTSFIKVRNPPIITPVFIVADYLYWGVNSTVNYNINLTNLTVNEVEAMGVATATTYNANNLNDFNSTLRYSNLGTQIDNMDPSIVSNDTDIFIYRKLQPSLGTLQSFVINFENALVNDVSPLQPTHSTVDRQAFWTDPFFYSGQAYVLEDDGAGNVQMSKVNGGATRSFIKVVGSINYATGLVNVNGVQIDTYAGNSLNAYALPAVNDVTVLNNTILTTEVSQLQFTAVQVRE